MLFSPSRRAFFHPDLNYPEGTLPADVITVTDARHRQLLSAINSGHEILLGPANRTTIKPAKVDHVTRRAMLAKACKRQAAMRIEAIAPAWRQLNDLRTPSAEGAARFAAIDAVREASDNVEAALLGTPATLLHLFDVANHPLWNDKP